jgi:predicted membrane protein
MRNHICHRIYWGLVVILVGVLYLLFNLGIIPAEWKNIVFSWQALLVVLGLSFIIGRHYFWGLFTLAAGIIFIMPSMSKLLGFPYPVSVFGSIVFPVAIIVIGLLIILYSFSHHSYSWYPHGCHDDGYHYEKDWTDYGKHEFKRSKFDNGRVDYNYFFSGSDEVFLEPVFKGGEINSVFGGLKLDLRRTSLPEGTTVLEINSAFGGVSMIVPKDWNIEIRETSVFGKFVDKRERDDVLQAGVSDGRKLVIRASSFMGGGDVRC